VIAAIHAPETLRAVFNAVCDRRDWRAPVNALAHGSAVPVVFEAVQFMTGTLPTVHHLGGEDFVVKSEGYRLGPCGDH
jgi:hypothetical protein